MKIEILGPSCDRCTNVKKMVDRLVKELGIEAEIVQVTDMNEILEYGILATPTTVIDGKPFFVGRVPSERDLKQKLMQFG